MKPFLFYIVILLIFLASGCTGLLKPEKEPNVTPPVARKKKKHKTVGDISRKKVTPPSPAAKKKDIKIEKEKMKEKEIAAYLDLAEKRLSEKEYDKAIELTKKIQLLDPKNKSALTVKNEAYYMSGKTLYKDNKYLDSLDMLQHVQQDYKDVKKITAAIKIKINDQAEHHYKKGVKYFINEELKKAIKEWEKTLVFNPDHPKALKDIENAKHILEELEKLN